METLHLMLVAGCRPNFVKIAPLLAAITARGPRLRATLVHSGQHSGEALSGVFFRDLGIRRPDHTLRVDCTTHATQTACLMVGMETTMRAEAPDLLLVVGDVNSTVAATLAAVKLGIPVAHVEAGLRSFDREMPEEINRLTTDALADYLFATEPSAVDNLRREGHPAERIHLVGNVMVDTLRAQRRRLARSGVLERLGVARGEYALLTVHRPSNVDDPDRLAELLEMLAELERMIPVVFPAHPRVARRIEEAGLIGMLGRLGRTIMTDPLGYLDFVRLMSEARLVLTDSGGVQEETTVLGVPCLTLRTSTERPVTVEQGTNVLVGTDPARALREARRILAGQRDGEARTPDLWDGRAAERIVDVLLAQRDRIAAAYPRLRARALGRPAAVCR